MTDNRRRALVTGASGDIGAAICRRLAGAGHYVYVHAHQNHTAAELLVEELNAKAPCSQAVVFDVTDGDATRHRLEELVSVVPIQVLVNNAGVHDDAAFPGMTAAQWHRVVDISVDGFFNVTHPLTLPMIRSRWGRIINISSITALIGNRGQVNYAAAKGALNAATRSLALELASRGITVNAVAPGIIAGRMTKQSFDSDTVARLVPMKRAGLPEEVAGLVGYLASDDAAYITGQVISISGGLN
ncbi:MAG: 3-oxoacyl-ACP reductase FabG [Gammaproteobacteria bacterium]